MLTIADTYDDRVSRMFVADISRGERILADR